MDFSHPVRAVIPGVQGCVLEVLAQTTAELNLRTLSRLAGVSPAQASRVLPPLVSLGLVFRREVPPSAQFLLNRAHVAAQAVLWLEKSADKAIERMRTDATALEVAPISMTVFGSLSRGDAVAESDVDVAVVRPDDVADDDMVWCGGMDRWKDHTQRHLGNEVNFIELSLTEVRTRLERGSTLWEEIARNGTVIAGRPLQELRPSPSRER